MTGAEAIELIRGRFGGVEGIDDRIQLEMMSAQQMLEHDEPKPEILLDAISDVEVNSFGYFTAPTGFLREYEMEDESDDPTSALWSQSLTDSSWKPMQKQRYQLLNQRYGGSTGQPLYYDLLGSTFYVFPIPADGDTYTLSLFYYKSEPAPSINGTNKWLTNYPELLIRKTGLTMCQFMEEDTKIWQALYQEAHGQFIRDNVARRQTNLRTILGGIR